MLHRREGGRARADRRRLPQLQGVLHDPRCSVPPGRGTGGLRLETGFCPVGYRCDRYQPLEKGKGTGSSRHPQVVAGRIRCREAARPNAREEEEPDETRDLRHFRELRKPKWSEAFRKEIERRTGATTFTYKIAVTRLTSDPTGWFSDETIKANLPGCPIEFLQVEEMWKEILKGLTERPAPSELGRLAQLLKAARLTDQSRCTPP